MAETVVCPTCQSPILVPANHTGETIACPQCEKLVAVPIAARSGERATTGFQPCPRCGAEGAKRVLFTPWGSFYGPALFHHVRCPECRYAYNGRSGGSNLIPAILFVAIPAVLMAAIIVFIVLLIIPHF